MVSISPAACRTRSILLPQQLPRSSSVADRHHRGQRWARLSVARIIKWHSGKHDLLSYGSACSEALALTARCVPVCATLPIRFPQVPRSTPVPLHSAASSIVPGSPSRSSVTMGRAAASDPVDAFDQITHASSPVGGIDPLPHWHRRCQSVSQSGSSRGSMPSAGSPSPWYLTGYG